MLYVFFWKITTKPRMDTMNYFVTAIIINIHVTIEIKIIASHSSLVNANGNRFFFQRSFTNRRCFHFYAKVQFNKRDSCEMPQNVVSGRFAIQAAISAASRYACSEPSTWDGCPVERRSRCALHHRV